MPRKAAAAGSARRAAPSSSSAASLKLPRVRAIAAARITRVATCVTKVFEAATAISGPAAGVLVHELRAVEDGPPLWTMLRRPQG